MRATTGWSSFKVTNALAWSHTKAIDFEENLSLETLKGTEGPKEPKICQCGKGG